MLYALAQWGKNFPASFGDEGAMVGKVTDWRELLGRHAWVSDDVFRRAVSLVRFGHKGPFVPELAALLDYCREAQRQVRAETERALPPPPKPAGPDDPGQAGAKAAARAYLVGRGLTSGEPGLHRRSARPKPITREEAAAAYERRGLAE